ncbi:MAG: PilN domain-containing protein [Rhizobiaceae bacterium]
MGALAGRLAPWLARRQAEFTLALSGGDAIIVRAGDASPDGSGVFPAEELAGRLAGMLKAGEIHRRGGIIRLGRDRHVLRALSSLSLPASRLAAAAALDLGVSTPFKADQVRILPVCGGEQASTCAIVKNSILDPVLAALRKNGIRVTGIEFETPQGVVALARSQKQLIAPNGEALRRRLAFVSGIAVALALCATFMHLRMRNGAALAAVSMQAEALAADAKIARAALDRRSAALAELSALRKNIENAEPVTGVWEELARVLPDSAYLTDLSVKGGEVSISGYAWQAAALVVALEQSPLFSKADFTAPVIKTPGIEGERFQLSLAAGG